ncbi:DUF4043 family protein [Pseudoalteromonas rubra]|uniref:phage capsid family protein n=1 Tax=Pseudoalteromonas rubra TaxID=43658 RepID=UPI002DB7E6E6|nr:DUF4043 family protein [Pseudoalteromonas rubra]MEC4091588.1 DUF4043 family protein [Pseudoalteromonas rubra]
MSIPQGARNIAFNAALFAMARKARTLTNLLSGKKANKSLNVLNTEQTDADHPIVIINDLTKQPGNTANFDVIHPIYGPPTMGGRRLAGRGSRISMSSGDIRVNQGRKMIEDGGATLNMLTAHNLQHVARMLIKNWYQELDEQETLYHLMGMRGSFTSNTDVIPLISHPEFNEIMINPILAPTFDRHVCASSTGKLSDIDPSDKYSLGLLDDVDLILEDTERRIRPIILPEAEKAGHDPFYVKLISPRQWYDLQASATTKDWNQLVANASTRQKGYSHPLFNGKCLMKNNILVKVMPRKVGVRAGDLVTVSQNDKRATPEQVQANTEIHRSVLLGGQALAVANGAHRNVKSTYKITEQKEDHGEVTEISLAYVHGKQAIQLEDMDGFIYDSGRMIVDTAVSTN